MIVVDGERCASPWVQHEPAHVGEERMAHFPLWMSHLFKVCNGLVRVFVLARGKF